MPPASVQKLYDYIQQNYSNPGQFGDINLFQEKVKNPEDAERLRQHLDNESLFGDSATFYDALNPEGAIEEVPLKKEEKPTNIIYEDPDLADLNNRINERIDSEFISTPVEDPKDPAFVAPTDTIDVSTAPLEEQREYTISAAPKIEPTKFNKFKDLIDNFMGYMIRGAGLAKTTTAENVEAQMIYAISQDHDLPLDYVKENYDELIRNPEITGVSPDPTTMESIELVMTGTVAVVGLQSWGAAARVALGVTGFMALDEAENAIISKIQDDPYVFQGGKNISDLLPEEATRTTKEFIEVLDLIGKALILGGVHRKGKEIFPKITKEFVTEYSMPKTIYLDPAKVKAIMVTGDKTKFSPIEKEILLELGVKEGVYKKALKDGVSIEVPSEKVINLVDKPWWAKAKAVFGKEKVVKEVSREKIGEVKETVRGLFPKVKETVAGRKVVFEPPIEVPAPVEAPVKPVKPPVKPVKPVEPVSEPVKVEKPVEAEIEPKVLDQTVEPIEYSKQIESKHGIKVDLMGQLDKGDITLSRIVIPKDRRKEGIGAEAMDDIIEYADRNDKRIVLTPSKDFGATSVTRLKKFYKRFGFVENKGTNKDFTTKESMYRDPTKLPKPVEAPVEKPVTAVQKEQTAKLNKQYNEMLQAQAAAQATLLREDLPGGKVAGYEQSFEKSTALLEDLELEAKTKGITLVKKPTETDAIIELKDMFQEVDPEVVYEERLSELRTLKDNIDDPLHPETPENAMLQIQASGRELAGLKAEDIQIAGENYQLSKDGTLVDIIKLHKGADMGTVIEERAETWYGTQEELSPNWDKTITKERRKYHERTGEKDDPTQSNLEWFSDKAKDNAIGAEPVGKVGAALQRIFTKFRQYAQALQKSAKKFARHVREGKVPSKLKTFLERAIEEPIKTPKEVAKAVKKKKPTYQLKKRKPLVKELSITTKKVKARKPSSVLKADVAIYLNNRSLQIQENHGIDLRPVKLKSGNWAEDTPEVRDIISDIIIDEIKLEIDRSKQGKFTAQGWYTEKIVSAMKEMEKLFPELKDPLQRDLFKTVLAITSNNQSVKINLNYAVGEYRNYLNTGKFNENFLGGGKARGAMRDHFAYLNYLQEELGLNGMIEFLTTKYVARDLERIGKKHFGDKFVVDELKDTEVYGSTIFGSKVGNGFFPNLLGDNNALTMDMWFMRTMGRIRGNLVERNYAPNLKKFRQELLNRGSAKYHQYGLKREDIIKENEEKLIAVADDIRKATQRRRFVGETQLDKDAKALIINYKKVMDSPRSPMERYNNREIMKEVSSKSGYEINDAQAIIWFPEKRLYRKLGVRNPEALETDYDIEAKRLVSSEQKRYGGRAAQVVPPEKRGEIRKRAIGVEEKAKRPRYHLKKLTPKERRLRKEREKSEAEQALKTAKETFETLRDVDKKTSELPKYARSINLEKQAIDDALKQLEVNLGKIEAKKVQTWDETGKIRDEILGDYDKAIKLLQKAKKQGIVNAAEMDALRQINVNAIHRLKEMVDTGIEKDLINEYVKYYEDIFKLNSDVSSEIGRALNIHKRTISENRMAKAFTELSRGLNERELAEFKKLNFENPLEVKRFIDRLGDPTFANYVYEYWYNAILSGIPTHMVNIASNTGWGLFQIPMRGLAGGIDKLITTFTGKQRQRFVNEMIPMFGGYRTGFTKGGRRFWKTIKTGEPPMDIDTKWEIEMGKNLSAFQRSPYKILRLLAVPLTIPTRALRGMDVWANSIAFDAQIASLARRSAQNKGLKGQEKKDYEEELKGHPTNAMIEDAKTFAKYNTFMDDPGAFTQWIINGRETVPGLRLIVPFVNTIANLLKRGVEFTPGVGLVRGKEYYKDQPAADIIAKQIVGATIALYLIYKVEDDEIIGKAPENKNEREAFYRQGKKAWSIKVGDKWVQYRRIEPFNTVIASVVIARDAMKKEKDEEKATEIFFRTSEGIAENLLDVSYLQGVSSFLDKHEKREGMFQRLGSSFVPYSGFWRSINRSVEVLTEGEAKYRPAKTFFDALTQVIPGLSKDAPAKLTVWGEEVVLEGGVFRQWLPYKWSEQTKDPLELEMQRVGIYPGLPGKRVIIRGNEIEFPDDFYRDYCIDFGKRAKIALERNLRPNLKPESAIRRYDNILSSERARSLIKAKNEYLKIYGK